MFIDDKYTREYIHQYILKHKLDKQALVINLNNTLPTERVTLPLPNVKLLNIPKDIVQKNEHIIDDITSYFEGEKINIDDELNLDQSIAHTDEDVH